jgi:hypothetical protein
LTLSTLPLDLWTLVPSPGATLRRAFCILWDAIAAVLHFKLQFAREAHATRSVEPDSLFGRHRLPAAEPLSAI